MTTPFTLLDPSASFDGYGRGPFGAGGMSPFDTSWGRQRSITSPVDIRPKSYVDASITTLWMGRRGRGKTLAMSTLAYIMQRRFIKYRTRGRLLSNYWIDFLRRSEDDKPIDLYSPTLIDEAIEYPTWLRDAFMTLDEIQTAATGRRSMSRTNVGLSTFSTQIRHRNVEMSFTTQFPQVLDYQLLLQIDLFITVDVLSRDEYGIPTALILNIHDYWGQWTGLNHRKQWPPPDDQADKVRSLAGVRNIIGHYSTKQIIAPTFSDYRDRILDEEDAALGIAPGEWEDATDAVEKAQTALRDNPGVQYTSLADMLARRFPDGESMNIQRILDPAMAVDPSIATVGGLRTRMKEMGFIFEGYIARRSREA